MCYHLGSYSSCWPESGIVMMQGSASPERGLRRNAAHQPDYCVQASSTPELWGEGQRVLSPLYHLFFCFAGWEAAEGTLVQPNQMPDNPSDRGRCVVYIPTQLSLLVTCSRKTLVEGAGVEPGTLAFESGALCK